MKPKNTLQDTTASDEYTERLRLRAIETGQIVPDETYQSRHPNMSLEAISQLRKNLIAQGFITPRSGGYRRGKRSVQ